MEIKDIKRIVDLMTKNNLAEFMMEEEGVKLRLKRGFGGETQVVSAPQMMAAPVAAPAMAAAEAAPAAESASDDGLIEIPSPIVGTFYSSASPEADSFIEVGTEVTEDTVVCIIEAMKVMNEIKAEVRGTVKKILVDNATPVQYGDPLFLVDPA